MHYIIDAIEHDTVMDVLEFNSMIKHYLQKGTLDGDGLQTYYIFILYYILINIALSRYCGYYSV